MIAFNLTSTLHTCALFKKNHLKVLEECKFQFFFFQLTIRGIPNNFSSLWINPLRVKVTVKLNKFLNFEHSVVNFLLFSTFIFQYIIFFFSSTCRCIQTFLRLFLFQHCIYLLLWRKERKKEHICTQSLHTSHISCVVVFSNVVLKKSLQQKRHNRVDQLKSYSQNNQIIIFIIYLYFHNCSKNFE